MIKLVLVRHGQSEWNLENRFTGWTDVELSEQGVRGLKRNLDKIKQIKKGKDYDCGPYFYEKI